MPRVYTTVQGDTWDIIALKMYKDERYMNVLLDANPSYNTTVIFPAGATLKVPDVVIPEYINLPPWKR